MLSEYEQLLRDGIKCLKSIDESLKVIAQSLNNTQIKEQTYWDKCNLINGDD